MNISTYNSFYACIYQVECIDDDDNDVYAEYHDISSPSVASNLESSITAAVDQVSSPVGTTIASSLGLGEPAAISPLALCS